MTRYLARSCPRCGDYLGVVVPQPPEPTREIPIHARCLKCGFKLPWKVIQGTKPGRSPVILGTVVLLACILAFVSVALAQDPGYRSVKRVVDGDTIVLENGERVRLIGVDTPETKHPKKAVEYFGKEASAFTKRMCQGKTVRLEFDQANTHLGHKDKYGRTLAYIFLDDGTFLNAEIVKQGYGFAYTRFPFRYLEEFRKNEREAREQGRGLWGKSK